MVVDDQLHSLILKVNEESDRVIKGWDQHFLWLEDVMMSAYEAKGKNVIPKTPAATRKRKRKISKENIDLSMAVVEKSPSEEHKFKKQKSIYLNNPTETENTLEIVNQEKLPLRKSTRIANCPAAKAVHTVQQELSRQTNVNNSDLLKMKATFEKPPTVTENIPDKMVSHKNMPMRHSNRIANAVDQKAVNTVQQGISRQASFNNIDSMKRKASIQETENIPEEMVSHDKMAGCQSNGIVNSPAPIAIHTVHQELLRQTSINNIDSSKRKAAFEPKGDSAVKVVKHAWSATGKTLSVRSARIPYSSSPCIDNRMKLLQLKNLTNSKTTGRITFLKSESPHIGSRLICPSSESRVGNIVTGMNSFLTRVQTVKPSKKDEELARQAEFDRKKEKEREIIRKKDEMMKARTDEKKRKNEERMRRAQETRENKERQRNDAIITQQKERKLREEEKTREEQDRKRKEVEKSREEKEKRNKLLAAKKEEKERARMLEQEAKELELFKKQEEIKRELLEEEMRQKQKRELLEEEMRQKQKMELFEEEMRQKKKKEQLEEDMKQKKKKLLLEEEMKKKLLLEEEMKQKLKEQLLEEQKKLAETRERHELEEMNKILEQKNEALRVKTEKYERIVNLKVKDNQTATEEACMAREKTQKDSPNAITSYEMTPVQKSKRDSNNYEIDDCKSDDSTDDDAYPKKEIPSWAKGPQLKKALFEQEYFAEDANRIFLAAYLLIPPNLDLIFYRKRSRFFTRTSSANWNTPPLRMNS